MDDARTSHVFRPRCIHTFLAWISHEAAFRRRRGFNRQYLLCGTCKIVHISARCVMQPTRLDYYEPILAKCRRLIPTFYLSNIKLRIPLYCTLKELNDHLYNVKSMINLTIRRINRYFFTITSNKLSFTKYKKLLNNFIFIRKLYFFKIIAYL